MAAWAPQCEAPPRESASFGCVWPSRLALKYKGEVDCYEVEQGASLPLLQQLEVARGPYTPVHPVHPLAPLPPLP